MTLLALIGPDADATIDKSISLIETKGALGLLSVVVCLTLVAAAVLAWKAISRWALSNDKLANAMSTSNDKLAEVLGKLNDTLSANEVAAATRHGELKTDNSQRHGEVLLELRRSTDAIAARIIGAVHDSHSSIDKSLTVTKTKVENIETTLDKFVGEVEGCTQDNCPTKLKAKKPIIKTP